MSIQAADALMGIFGFERVADDEITLDNPPSLDDDGGLLNEGMKMEESAFMKKVAGQLEVVGWRRMDRKWDITTYPSVCATWHKIGAPVDAISSHSEAIAGYAVRDARISALEFELEVARTDELSAAVWAATETIKHELWDAQAELADAKETISRYETTAENCEVLRAELAAIYAAPVAKQDNAAKMPCGAAVSNVYEAYEAGLVAKQVVMPSVDAVMRLVLDFQDNHRKNVTGTTNWAANLGMHILDAVRLLNAADQEGSQDE